MGGAKSKPYVSSAGSVINRKSVEHVASNTHGSLPTDGAVKATSEIIKPALVEAPTARQTIERINKYMPPPEKPMDAGILREMSKWNMVSSKKDDTNYKLLKEGEDMAVVIRHRDDMALIQKFGRAPKTLAGKVTEMQLLQIMKAALEKPELNGASQVATSYNLKEDSVKQMLAFTRYPVISPNKENPDLLIAK
jgi:hypothetical protein